MPNPTRETTGGRIHNDLRNLAKREGLSSADVMLGYTLERFLYRLAQAPEGGRHFVLKDYADLYRLICQNDLDATTIRTAVERTADHRGLRLRTLSTVIGALPANRQPSCTRWLSKQQADRDAYPASFAEVCATVVAFADPLLADTAVTRWSATHQRWR
jgi:hypothetical protein